MILCNHSPKELKIMPEQDRWQLGLSEYIRQGEPERAEKVLPGKRPSASRPWTD